MAESFAIAKRDSIAGVMIVAQVWHQRHFVLLRAAVNAQHRCLFACIRFLEPPADVQLHNDNSVTRSYYGSRRTYTEPTLSSSAVL